MQRVSHAHRAEGTQVCSVRAMATQRVPGHEPTIERRNTATRPTETICSQSNWPQSTRGGGRARYSGKGTSPGAVVFKEDGGSCPSQPRAAAAAPCGCRPFPHNQLLAKFPERAMRCLCIGIKGLFECPSINIMLRLCIIRVASCVDFVSAHAEQLRREQLLDCTQHSHRKMTTAGEGTQCAMQRERRKMGEQMRRRRVMPRTPQGGGTQRDLDLVGEACEGEVTFISSLSHRSRRPYGPFSKNTLKNLLTKKDWASRPSRNPNVR